MTTLSKYYKRCFVGIGVKGADESGREYHWDTTHPDLEPTETFSPSKYGRVNYCSYCGQPAKSIQANLREYKARRPSSDYDVTGYTCDCEGAEAEKEYRKEQELLMIKYQEDLSNLRKSFLPLLKQNTDATDSTGIVRA